MVEPKVKATIERGRWEIAGDLVAGLDGRPLVIEGHYQEMPERFEFNLPGQPAFVVIEATGHVPVFMTSFERNPPPGTWRALLQHKAYDAPSGWPDFKPALHAEAPSEDRIARGAEVWFRCYQQSSPDVQSGFHDTTGIDQRFDEQLARAFLSRAEDFADALVDRALTRLRTDGDALAVEPAAVPLREAFIAVLPQLRKAILGGSTPTEWDTRLASWLENMGDNVGAADVEKCNGSWKAWLPSDEAPPLRRLTFAIEALWRDVRRRLEREQRPVRLPQPVGQAMVQDRPRTVDSLRTRRKPQGLDIDWTSNVMVEKSGVQLVLPLDVMLETGASKRTTLQSVLTGGLLRTYLATWAACADHCNENRGIHEGLFPWEEYAIFREYITEHGRIGRKPSGKEIALLRRDFEALSKFRVAMVGDAKIGSPEALINFYEQESTGRRIYIHAPAIRLLMGKNFAQVPRAVLRLSADDVAAAMGLAVMLRQLATTMLKNAKSHEGELRQLLEVCGEDVTGGLRKHGPAAYWQAAARRIQRICRDGELGHVEIAGDDPGAPDPSRYNGATTVKVIMHDRLATAYQPLLAAANEHRRATKRLSPKRVK